MSTEEFQRQRVLMIDEEQALLDLTEMAFKEFFDIEFYMMNHPRIGIQVAAARAPHLLVTEVLFPKNENFDGAYLIHAVKEVCPWVKIIVCSRVKDESLVQRCISELGVAAFLRRPFDVRVLLNKAAILLNMPRPFTS